MPFHSHAIGGGQNAILFVKRLLEQAIRKAPAHVYNFEARFEHIVTKIFKVSVCGVDGVAYYACVACVAYGNLVILFLSLGVCFYA